MIIDMTKFKLWSVLKKKKMRSGFVCKVSVIVTVYNTEKYVEECIISLINQTYKNIEVILIDGGSTDKTPEICHKYEKEYENIRVVHKENEGVSAARNRGIEEATGDYILFVDGDDWIENNTIETLVWLEEENESDIAFIIKAGNEHRKFMRQIFVSVDITAPLYWWKEFDTYKVGTVANSTSTMHKLATTPITLDCFEIDDYDRNLSLADNPKDDNELNHISAFEEDVIMVLENLRQKYLETKDKRYWKELIRFLPESWLQKRTITMNYENIRNMYFQRKNHKLTEWSESFIKWVESLPYAEELIMYDCK